MAEAKVDKLITIGEFSKNVKHGAVQSGMKEESIFTFEKTDDVLEQLNKLLQTEDDVLVKASRAMQFEKIVAKIEENKF